MGNYLIGQSGKLMKFDAHKQPVFKEEKRFKWVLWGNDKEYKNNQPAYYDWLYNSSSKHRAILNRKNLFITGKGWKADDFGSGAEDKLEIRAFAAKLEDAEFTRKIAKNFTEFNGFAYEVIFDKAGKKIMPHYINFGNLRRSKIEYDAQGREKDPVYYYTADWSARKPEENKDFTIFKPFDWETGGTDRQIVYYSADEDCAYPLPEYTAAVPYIAADYEVGNFTYNNTKNGFAGSYLVNFYNGEPSNEQKSKIEKAWKKSKHGSDNAGDPILSFNEDKDSGVEVTPLPANGQDDRYINLNNQIREEIFSGHTVDPVVVGLKGESGFNNNADEKRIAIEDFQTYYVRGKQMIIEQHVNAVKTFNEIRGKLTIERLDPLQAEVSEAELAAILTTNERRLRAGYEEVEDGDIIAKETNTFIQLSKDEKIIQAFSECGTLDENFTFLGKKELFALNTEDAEKQATTMLHDFATKKENTLLDVLKNNPEATTKELAELLDVTEKEIDQMLLNLIDEGLIDEEKNVVRDEEEVFVVYKYAKRSDVSGGDVIDTTRDFCKSLVVQSKFKSWTLQDIKLMNNGMGLDVFTSRGGWYTIPGTDRHVPFCRHVFEAHLVRKKK